MCQQCVKLANDHTRSRLTLLPSSVMRTVGTVPAAIRQMPALFERQSFAEKSSVWSEGHRFWCSAKDGDEDAENVPESSRGGANGGNSSGSVRRRERLVATTEITDAAIRTTATAMAFRPIEGGRPPEGPGWGRAFYEPSPFDITPGPARRPVIGVGQEAAAAMGITPSMGRRGAETMPDGMIHHSLMHLHHLHVP
jgi:hypothetical protein